MQDWMIILDKEELYRAKEKINEIDTVLQTYGCRHNNPDICSNNSLPDVCAFTSYDCICKRLPRSWKKLFEELKKMENNKTKEDSKC